MSPHGGEGNKNHQEPKITGRHSHTPSSSQEPPPCPCLCQTLSSWHLGIIHRAAVSTDDAGASLRSETQLWTETAVTKLDQLTTRRENQGGWARDRDFKREGSRKAGRDLQHPCSNDPLYDWHVDVQCEGAGTTSCCQMALPEKSPNSIPRGSMYFNYIIKD